MDLALCRVSPPRKRATLPHDKSHMSGQLSTIPEPVNAQALLAANGMPTPAQQPRPAASARRRSKSDLAASDGLASGIGGHAGMPGHLMHQMAPGLHLQHSVDQILRSFQQGSSSFGAGAITASSQVSSTHGDLVPMFPRPSPQTVPSSVAPMALPNPPAIVGSSGTPMSLLLPTQPLPAPGFDISHLTSMLHAVSQPPPTGLPAECAGGHESHATDSVLVLKEMSPQSAARSGAGPSHPGDASLSADATTLARTLGTAAESIRTAAGDYGGILVDRVLRVVDGNIPDPIQEDKMPEAPTMR
ncbi:hypothetical protein H4R21_000013 [Coemansia helicoidea]|uniref:Uncharacterized protein n=1 Tax=Coemansia helicoidea TaxID=1286919 RepID=A0ACC1LHJ5_9FUNG|nr:hypothetical protein H4R21_000013 [Coemansia helicoidea]